MEWLMVQVLTLVETKAEFVEIIRFHVFGAYPWQWKKEGGWDNSFMKRCCDGSKPFCS